MATATPAKWTSHENMPTKRVFSTAVEVDGILYIAGGCDARGTPVDTFESYNPRKKKWFRLANMPTKRAGVCVLAVGKKIVALGGVNTLQEPTEEVEIYDVEKKKWMGKEDGIETLKDRLLGLSGVVREDRILVVGGMGYDTNPKDFLMSYDLETNKWKSLPPMPTPRYATFSFLINDKLYVLGGRQGKVPVPTIEMFDFETNKWTTYPNVSTKRVFVLYAHTDKKIFSIGGLQENPKDGFSDATDVFDIEAGEWTDGAKMPTKRGDFAIGVHGNKVVAAGGLGNAGKPMTDVDVYDSVTDTWSSLPPLPTAHCSCAFAEFQGKLHVVGGLSLGGPSNAMESLTWKEATD